MKTHRRGNYGSGTIEQRGPGRFRLTHYVKGERQREWVTGTRSDAARRLRELTARADAGEHVRTTGLILEAWVGEWLLLLSRGEHGSVRRRGLVSPRTYERYEELLRSYVCPALGHIAVQKLTPTEIDHLYINLERRLSVTTVRHVHVALKACLATAVRKGKLLKNPVASADPPRTKAPEVGQALTTDEVTRLLTGFRATVYYAIVATAVMTGLRLSELLALRWIDVDFEACTISVTRAVEQTKKYGLAVKEPKSWRSKRTIGIDPALVVILKAEHEQHLRLRAGVSITSRVSLGAVRLPADALVFPAPSLRDGKFNFTALRNPRALTKEIREKIRKIGFAKLRFHDLRGTHSTALLDAGVPVHTVAERMGHRPEILLRRYAKRTRTADDRTAGVLSTLAQSLA
jgi:integrase